MKNIVLIIVAHMKTHITGNGNSSNDSLIVGCQSHQFPIRFSKIGYLLLEKGNSNFKAQTFPCVKLSSKKCEKSPVPKLIRTLPSRPGIILEQIIPSEMTEIETIGACKMSYRYVTLISEAMLKSEVLSS